MKQPLINWQDIDTVLLDMDGTLLDLHFDTYFWRDYVPYQYAKSRGLDIPTAKRVLAPRFQSSMGTLDWYCVDYWTRTLRLDIAQLKREVAHLIAIKPGAPHFLNTLAERGMRRILVTNAHRKSIALKLEKTRLEAYLDEIVCAHDLGRPKEDPLFWQELQTRLGYDPARTLLIDDNIHALKSARKARIAHLLAVLKPSSREANVDTQQFACLDRFEDITPE
jgi:putative hydrolase of the HAD superfamily